MRHINATACRSIPKVPGVADNAAIAIAGAAPAEAERLTGQTLCRAVDDGLWGLVLDSRKSIITNTPAGERELQKTPLGPLLVQRFLSAPALIEERVVGQIAVVNSDCDYTERDLLLVKRLAVLYAFAVERIWADKELMESEKKYRELTNSLPSRFSFRITL